MELEDNYQHKPPRHLRLIQALILLLMIVFIFIIGLQLLRRGLTQPTSGMAPDFAMTTFNGENFRLSDLRGQIVIVNFWASWCLPCREEAPILQSVWERYRERGVTVVGIAYLDSETEALAFLAEFNVTYPNGQDLRTEISNVYRIQGVPETFVIDRDGNIVEFIIAPVREGQLEAIIERLR